MDALKKDIEVREQRISSLQKQQNELQNELANKKTQIEEFESKTVELQNLITKGQEEIEKLRKDLKIQIDEKNKRGELIKNFEASKLELQEQIKKRELQLESSERVLIENQETIAKKKDHVSALELKLTEYHNEVVKITESKLALEYQVKELNNLLEKRTREARSLEAQIAKNNEIITNKNEEIQNFKSRIAEFQITIDKKNEEIISKELLLNEFKNLIDKKEDKLAILEKRIDEYIVTFTEQREKILTLEFSVKEHAGDIERKGRHITNLETQRTKLQEIQKNLEQQILGFKEKIDGLNKTLAQKNSNEITLKQKLKEHEDTVNTKDSQIIEFENHISELNTIVSDFEEKHKTLSYELEALNLTLHEKNTLISTLEGKYNELLAELSLNEKTIDKLKDTQKEFEDSINQKNHIISSYEDKQLEQDSVINEKEALIQSLQEQLQNFGNLLREKDSSINEYIQNQAELDEQLNQREQFLHNIEEVQKQLLDDITNLEERIIEFEKKYIILINENNSKGLQISELEENNKKLFESWEDSLLKLSEVEENSKELFDSWEKSLQKLSEVEEKQAELVKTVSEKDSIIKNLNNDYIDVSEALIQREKQISLLESEIEEYSFQVSKLESSIEKLDDTIRKKNLTISQKETNIKDEKKKNNELNVNLQEKELLISELNEINAKLKQLIEEKEAIINDTTKKLIEQQKINENIAKKNKQLADNLDKNSSQITNLSEKNSNLNKINERLKSDLEEKEKVIIDIKKSYKWFPKNPFRNTAYISFPVKRIMKYSFRIVAFTLALNLDRAKKEARFFKTCNIIKKSGLFDPAWYLENNPDVKNAGIDPIEHYVRRGVAEGRNPTHNFDTKYYRKQNTDIDASGLNPFAHYILYGKNEGRIAYPQKRKNEKIASLKVDYNKLESILSKNVEGQLEYGISIIVNISEVEQSVFDFIKWYKTINDSLKTELIIFDRSTSGLYLNNQDSTIRVIKVDPSLSEVACKNQGVEASNYKFILFVIPEIQISSIHLEKAIEELDKNTYGAIGCTVCETNTNFDLKEEVEVDYYAGISFKWDDENISIFSEKISSDQMNSGETQQNIEIKKTDAITYGFFICKKSDIKILGGFSQNYRNGYEDIDLCLKLRKRFGKLSGVLITPNEIGLNIKDTFLNLIDDYSKIQFLQQNEFTIINIINSKLSIGVNNTLNQESQKEQQILFKELFKFKQVAQTVFNNLLSRHKENRLIRKKLSQKGLFRINSIFNNIKIHHTINQDNILRDDIEKYEKLLLVKTECEYGPREFQVFDSILKETTYSLDNKYQGLKRFHNLSVEIKPIDDDSSISGLQLIQIGNGSFVEVPNPKLQSNCIAQIKVSLYHYKGSELNLFYTVEGDNVYNSEKCQKKKVIDIDGNINSEVIFELGTTYLTGPLRISFDNVNEPFWINKIQISLFKKEPHNGPLLSFIIPCYNHGDFVEETVNSILQIEDRSKYEVIIVDDGSTDENCIRILGEQQKKGVKLIRQINSGLGKARNIAIEQSKGKYILPVDADNKLKPAYFFRSIEMFETDPQIGVVYSDVWFFGEKEFRRKMEPHSISHQFIQNKIDACAAFRKEVWEQVGGYQEQMIGYQDWEFWAAVSSLNYWKFYHLRDIGFEYRKLAGSMVSHTKLFTEEILDYISARHARNLRKQHKELFLKQLEDSQNGKLGKEFGANIYFKRDIEPLVTVIAPNYNKERFLKLRLNTILKQTYKNVEIIVLDDASSDNSVDLIKKMIKNDSRARLEVNTQNSGNVFKQWKKGLELAKGEIIWIAECDDYCSTDFLSKLVPHLTTNLNIQLAYCQSNFVDTNGKVFDNHLRILEKMNNDLWRNDFIIEGNEFIRDYMTMINCLPNASGVVFRKELVNMIDWDKVISYKVCGDWWIWTKFLTKSNLYFCSEPMNYFRFDSQTQRSKEGKDLTRLFEHLYILKMISHDIGLSPTQKNSSLEHLLKRTRNHINNSGASSDQIEGLLMEVFKLKGNLSFSFQPSNS